LALIRGKWVEVDHERLSRTLEQFKAIERRAVTDGLSFGEAMRMLAGAGIAGDVAAGEADVAWAETVAGPWLAETLAALRHPDRLSRADSGRSLQGTLRPYQPKQTRMVKQLRAETRFALTGTPIEKSARRPLVDLRLHQSRIVGIVVNGSLSCQLSWQYGHSQWRRARIERYF
jgi:hypothetical protein